MTDTETLHIFADDIAQEESWQLLRWCHYKGANEFTISMIGIVQETQSHLAQSFDSKFAPFYRGLEPRRVLTSRTGNDWVRPVALWILNNDSIEQLREILSEGIFTYGIGEDIWFEDLYVYRSGELMLGVVTHEREGLLRLTAKEIDELEQIGIKYRLKGDWVEY